MHQNTVNIYVEITITKCLKHYFLVTYLQVHLSLRWNYFSKSLLLSLHFYPHFFKFQKSIFTTLNKNKRKIWTYLHLKNHIPDKYAVAENSSDWGGSDAFFKFKKNSDIHPHRQHLTHFFSKYLLVILIFYSYIWNIAQIFLFLLI